jgi:potassium efflux system protein
MRQLAEQNPMVLDDPPPTVFFCEFADSSLTFELRVFHRDVFQRMPLTHELNTAINTAFAEHGIEIAFPQQDIHVRSVPTGVALQPVVPAPTPVART